MAARISGPVFDKPPVRSVGRSSAQERLEARLCGLVGTRFYGNLREIRINVRKR